MCDAEGAVCDVTHSVMVRDSSLVVRNRLRQVCVTSVFQLFQTIVDDGTTQHTAARIIHKLQTLRMSGAQLLEPTMLLDEGLVFTVERVQLLTADCRSELAVVAAQNTHNELSKGGLAEGTACHARFMFFPLLDHE